jgi:hypothetical protein
VASEAEVIARSLSPLDGLRRGTFRLALGSRVLSALVVRRDRRLAFFASLHAAAAFVLAVYYPVLLFVLGPVVLGVAHVAADVRYLVLRRRLEGWWRYVVVASCSAFVLLAVLAQLRWFRLSDRVEFGLAVGWAVTGVVAGALESRAFGRAMLGVALSAAVAAAAFSWPRGFRLAYLHGHNLVALAVWPLFFRRRLALLGWLRVPIVGAAVLLASGVAYRASLASPGARQFGLHVLELSDWVAPVLRADLAVGLTSAFVFLQAVHYSVWLSIVPQAAMAGEGTLSFRQSYRSLRADFGGLGFALVLVCMLGVLLFATAGAPRASATYLGLAMFHGYLELVLLLYFWIARRPLTLETCPRSGPGGMPRRFRSAFPP